VKTRSIFVILIILIFVVLILSVLFGSSTVGPGESAKTVLGSLGIGEKLPKNETILYLIRIPRVLVAMLSGMALGLAGFLSQSLFRNDLADPYIAGIGSGAILGVNLTLFFGANVNLIGLSTVSISAFIGALLSCFVIWSASNKSGSTSTSLVLAGVALSFLLSGVNFLIVMLGRDILSKSVFWSWNGLSSSNWMGVFFVALSVAISVTIIPFYSRSIDIYQLGDEESMYLGVNPKMVRNILFVITSVLTGISVAIAGLLGFVGLMTPHICRRLVGAESKNMIWASLLVGGIVLGLADFLGRVIIPHQEIPASVIMSIIGGLFFFALVLRKPIW
jgi:iron complex transport system permease protein